MILSVMMVIHFSAHSLHSVCVCDFHLAFISDDL